MRRHNDDITEEMIMQKDYYDILQLTPQATDDDIRHAHRQLARQYHPDVNKDPSAADTFQAVQEAYEVLSNAKKRAKHDQWRKQQGLDQPPALR
ncbi:MAG: DnaJ domain-containing protein, partial [Okeania sp. SIO3B3]|nr:DnaJ domain-containing protein [Okeania sp. SIO3B3]